MWLLARAPAGAFRPKQLTAATKHPQAPTPKHSPSNALNTRRFGNATELIIAGFAIKKGYLRVVKLTLLGSIVSNLLLVMGSAFIAGGARHQVCVAMSVYTW